MLRKIWIVLGAVALIIGIFSVAAFAGDGWEESGIRDDNRGAVASYWTVCSIGCDFPSIQAAVDAAGDGDTIVVRAETASGTGPDQKTLTVHASRSGQSTRSFGSWRGFRSASSLSGTSIWETDGSKNTQQAGNTSVSEVSLRNDGSGPAKKVTLCHIPPGNPVNARTVVLGESAGATHLAHGDLLGPCPYECDNGVPSPVPQTGLTFSYAEGDDGDYQTGVSVDPRFTDNGDGTVTDNLTGLIWLRSANCFGYQYWSDAVSVSNTLADGSCGLTDSSVAGDWRLPNLRELHSLIDYGERDPALPDGHPFSTTGGTFWSSTGSAAFSAPAWVVSFLGGDISAFRKEDYTLYVWPVRGGQ